MSPARGAAGGAALVPSVILAVLSKFTCSLCIAAYASVLSSLGLGFMMTARGFANVTYGLLALGLASLAWSASRHRRYVPLVLGTLAAVLIVLGRLGAGVSALLYTGSTVMALAAVWNLWAARRPSNSFVQLTSNRIDPS